MKLKPAELRVADAAGDAEDLATIKTGHYVLLSCLVSALVMAPASTAARSVDAYDNADPKDSLKPLKKDD